MAGPFSVLEKCLDGASGWGESLDCFYDLAKTIKEDFSEISGPINDGNDDGQLPDNSFADFTQGIHNIVKTTVLAKSNLKLILSREDLRKR
jgi:hypothetical protein